MGAKAVATTPEAGTAQPSAAIEGAEPRQEHRPQSMWRRFASDRVALGSGIFLAIVVLAALLAPLLAPHDPFAGELSDMLKPMGSPGFILGTDGQGRDILSRLLYGTRLTLIIGVVGVAIGGTLGAFIGLFSTYYPALDKFFGRITDIMLSFPAILFGMALVAVTGPGVLSVILALAFATVPGVARISRSSGMVVIRQEYMEAGRAVGLRDGVLIWRYLTLNCISTIFVYLSLRFGQVILLGAVFSFLGLGAKPPAAELGMMASQGRDYLFMAPHVATIPSLAIFLIVLAFNLLSDSARDVLDPRLRQ
ncbi:MAG: ABC transporter permease [Deltaproteobacteria bacterium]|nr:ABC transporter permease [Deltaproteobacteria bacterium]